ncbi:MAG: NUDIX hydrolase [Alphaproteobacteria bacterium]|nr:NUDIX hydrolase [Alphaproteobacteria bacterium]
MREHPPVPPAPKTCCEFVRRVPDGDTFERDVCATCGHIHYVNPKIVVGAVCSWHGRILLCRRAIEPRQGFWTIPAGYLEERETPADGAAREAWEEATVKISIDRLLAVYSIARISQVQLIFRADLVAADFAPGIESLETKLFAWEEIPWDALAFPSVHWALNDHRKSAGRQDFAPFANPAA